MITDFPRRSSRSAFLRRFLIFPLIYQSVSTTFREKIHPSSFLSCLFTLFLSQKNRFRFRTSHSPLVFVCCSPHFLPLSSADGRRTIRSLPRSSIQRSAQGRESRGDCDPSARRRDSLRAKRSPEGRASRAVKAQAIAIAHAGAPPLLPVNGTFGLFCKYHLNYGSYFTHRYILAPISSFVRIRRTITHMEDEPILSLPPSRPSPPSSLPQ